MKIKWLGLGALLLVGGGFTAWNVYVESRPVPPDVSCVAATVRHEARDKKEATKKLVAYTLIQAAREERLPVCQFAREQRVTQRRGNAHHQALDVRMPALRSWWQVWAHSALKPELEKEWRDALRVAREVLDDGWAPEEKLRSAIRFRSAALMSVPNAQAFIEVPLLPDRREFVHIGAMEGLDFYRKK
jgi:hypothetical protein